MLIKDQIYEFVKRNTSVVANDVGAEFGLNRWNLQKFLKELVDEGKIYRRGNAKRSFYTVDPTAADTSKPDDLPITLPDKPELILNWMGYNNKKPNPLQARLIEFEW